MNNGSIDPVLELQEWLRELHFAGYPIELVTPSGTYGDETRAAVRQFQVYAGLEPSGIVDEETWNRLRQEYKNALYEKRPPSGVNPFPDEKGFKVDIGQISDLVTIIQLILRDVSAYMELDFDDISGIYDGETRDAVAEFQRRSGLEPTGVVDKRTWDALTEFYNKNNRGY